MSPEEVVAQLRAMGEEIEDAYIPAIKYPAGPQRASGSGGRGKSRGGRRKRARASAPNDPLNSRQWGHAAVRIHQARSRASFVDASGIVVAVVDSGIDEQHPDLVGVVSEYRNGLAPNESDRDFSGHGTHVAGIIAATINNKVGIAGLCQARILAIKGLPDKSPWDAAKYYQALAYPINRAKVLNLSLGGGYDPGEEAVIQDLLDAGIVVVAAMGNEFEEGNPISYPAAYKDVIAVGATDEADRRGPFSNTGPHIALAAPGVNILSTVPQYPASFAKQPLYDSWDGTSMATPHVAAAAALMLARTPSLSVADVRKRLMATADKVPGQTSFNEEFGAGRLNIDAALA
jgi:subtilisin family serine protease